MMEQNKKITVTLKKASTHLKRVIEMLERGEYCIDILQQNLAVIGLLRSANKEILGRHLQSCFAQAMKGTNETRKKEMIEEILHINKLSN